MDGIARSATRDSAGRARAGGALGAARKVAVLVVGVTVLAAGVALIVLPGPAFLVIPAGLAILATEFLWARRLLQYAKDRAARLLGRRRRSPLPLASSRPVASTKKGRPWPISTTGRSTRRCPSA